MITGAILSALERHPEGLETAQVVELVGARADTVVARLSKLKAWGQVRAVGAPRRQPGGYQPLKWMAANGRQI